MAELKRIVNKRFVLFIVLLLVFNMFVYIKEQYDSAENYITEEYENVTSREAFNMYAECLNDVLELKKAGIETEHNVDETLYARIWNSAIGFYDSQTAYMSVYAQRYSQMLESAENMSAISIFSQENSFSRRNIEKTLEDFEATAKVETEYVNSEWITSVMNFKLYDYCIILVIVYVVMQFCSEGKSSLMYFIHSTANGRVRLVVNRILILACVCVGSGVLFYYGSFFTSAYIYRIKNGLSATIQSLEMFQESPLMLDVGQFIFLCGLMRMMTFFMLGLLVWAVFSAIKNDRISIIVMVVVLAVEYYAYYNIDSQSVINYFKYINIFNYINSQDVAGIYKNLNIFSYPLNMYDTYMWIIAAVIVIMIFVCVYKGAYVYSGRNRIVSKVSVLYDKARKIISERFDRTGIIFGELRKILFDMGGIFVVLAAVYVLFMQADDRTLYRSEQSNLIQTYYDKLGERYTPGMETEIEVILLDLQSKYNRLMGSDYSGESSMMVSNRVAALEMNINAAQTVKEQVLYLKELYEEKNISGYLVEQLGARYLFGKIMNDEYFYHAMLISIFAAFLSGGVYAYEKKSNMIKSINSMYSGRRGLKLSKLLWCVIFTDVFIIVLSVVEFCNVENRLGIAGLDVPLSSFMMFEGSGLLNVTLFQFFVVSVIVKCLFGVAGVIIALNISKMVGKVVYGQMFSALVLTLPGILYYMGIEIVKPFAITRWYTITEILTKYEIWSGEFYVAIGASVLLIAAGTWLYLKKEK